MPPATNTPPLAAGIFIACGEDSRGAFVRTFKELTGMTPTEFRNSL